MGLRQVLPVQMNNTFSAVCPRVDTAPSLLSASLMLVPGSVMVSRRGHEVGWTNSLAPVSGCPRCRCRDRGRNRSPRDQVGSVPSAVEEELSA